MMIGPAFASISLALAFAAALPAQTPTGFLDRTVAVGTLRMQYQVFVPLGYDGHRKLPVILFMHGSGERGSDGLKQTQVGMPSQIRWHREWFDAVVVMPQCPDDSVFRGAVAQAAFAALEKSVKEFHGDRHRLYITGLSMGGYGVWQQLVDHPGVFAAAVTVSGGLTRRRPGGAGPRARRLAARAGRFAQVHGVSGRGPRCVGQSVRR